MDPYEIAIAACNVVMAIGYAAGLWAVVRLLRGGVTW